MRPFKECFRTEVRNYLICKGILSSEAVQKVLKHQNPSELSDIKVEPHFFIPIKQQARAFDIIVIYMDIAKI